MARNANRDLLIIDAEILNCIVCTERLKSPIFQCRNGHYVCIDCKDKIQNKCPFCRRRIDNIRCLAMDRILESARPFPPITEVIELSDGDSDSEAEPIYNPNEKIWCYYYPQGKKQGPFSLADLKGWNDQEYFLDIPDFKVWKDGDSPDNAVSLISVLRRMIT